MLKNNRVYLISSVPTNGAQTKTWEWVNDDTIYHANFFGNSCSISDIWTSHLKQNNKNEMDNHNNNNIYNYYSIKIFDVMM